MGNIVFEILNKIRIFKLKYNKLPSCIYLDPECYYKLVSDDNFSSYSDVNSLLQKKIFGIQFKIYNDLAEIELKE